MAFGLRKRADKWIEELPIGEWVKCPIDIHIASLMAAYRRGQIEHKFQEGIHVMLQHWKWGTIKRVF